MMIRQLGSMFCALAVVVSLSSCGMPESPSAEVQAKQLAEAKCDTADSALGWDALIAVAAKRGVMVKFGENSGYVVISTAAVGATLAEIDSAIEVLRSLQIKAKSQPPVRVPNFDAIETNVSRTYNEIVILQGDRKRLLEKLACPKI